jgi:hypothetical protein
MAEDDGVPGVGRDRAEETLVVGKAADDPVKDHDVGRRDRRRILRDVVDPPVDAALGAGFSQETPRLALVAGRHLEVRHVRRPAREQLEADLADAAADLEDARVREADVLEERDHAARRPVEASLAVAARRACGEALVEESRSPAGRNSASPHDRSASPS